jgi:hypothetical protein
MKSSSLTPITLPTLNERRDWTKWNIKVQETATTGHEYGILQLLISNAAFLDATEEDAAYPAFEIPVPGVEPAHTPAGPYTTWMYATDTKSRILQASKHLLGAMVDSLGPAILTLVSDPKHGTLRFTIRTLYTRLEEKLGTYLASDLRQTRLDLEARFFRPEVDNIREFTTAHKIVHNIFSANDESIGKEQKVSMLRATLLPCGLFEGTFSHFLQKFPAKANQTFANYEELLHEAADNQVSTTTAGSGGYANMMRVPCTGCSCPNCPNFITTALSATATPSLIEKSNLYCWSHGGGNHSGIECTHQCTGHQATATLARQQKGNPHRTGTMEARKWLKEHLPPK